MAMTEQIDNNPRTLEQKRAEKAYLCIKEILDGYPEGDSYRTNYASLAQGLNQMILVNGLGSTLAFLRAKAKGKDESESHHQRLYHHLNTWVGTRIYGNGDLLNYIVTKSSNDLRRATAEAIAFSVWLRRCAEAEFGDVRDQRDEGDEEP